MKTWLKYRQYSKIGQWHIHTSFTDGFNTIDEYCKTAINKNIPLIAFTEHVRKQLTYCFDDFLNAIDEAKSNYKSKLIILSGFEAKVLPTGKLDILEQYIKSVDYPTFAYHQFPNNFELYLKTLIQVIYEYPELETWLHPSLFLLKNQINISISEIANLLHLMKQKNIAIEINSSYQLPTQNWKPIMKSLNTHFVRGDNIHSIDELIKFEENTAFINGFD